MLPFSPHYLIYKIVRDSHKKECANQGHHVQGKGEKNTRLGLWSGGRGGQDEDKVLGAQKV